MHSGWAKPSFVPCCVVKVLWPCKAAVSHPQKSFHRSRWLGYPVGRVALWLFLSYWYAPQLPKWRHQSTFETDLNCTYSNTRSRNIRLLHYVRTLLRVSAHLMVPMNSTGSWGIMDNFKRKSSKPISAMLIPSICIKPDSKFTSLNSATPSEDLPEPVLPTIPKCSNRLEWARWIRNLLPTWYLFSLWVWCRTKRYLRPAANWLDSAF